jgi:hypothetical protein
MASLLGLCLVAWPAHAETVSPHVALAVTRAPGTDACVEAPALARAVEQRLNHSVFVEATSRVDLKLELELEARSPRGFRSVIVLRDAQGGEIGRRELETSAPHCSSLDDSLALVVALLVDSPEAQARVESQHQAASVSEPTAPPAPPAPPTKPHPLMIPADTLAPREPYRVDVVAAFAGLVGELPGIAFGGTLVLAVRPPHFVELRLRPAFFPSSEADGPAPGRGGRFSLIEMGLDVCPLETELSEVRLLGCVGQTLGRVKSSGYGFLRNASTGSLVYSLGVGASAVWKVAPPLVVVLGLSAAAPVERNAYISRAPDGTSSAVFRASPLTLTALGGIGVEL